ncbi:class I SAM-dependent methyltransferase [Alkalihalobacillus sp. R86527]|uniref:class I SAM-dependent methyltransferase n=1 Tax=Alkalihalobacillus sp. R86527 TaxID=3093863 RepID=UPI00366D27FC
MAIDLFDFYLTESEKPFSGWDFSYIADTGRIHTDSLPWCYTSEILALFKSSASVLDMGTGGGEFLEKLQPYPEKLAATEGYPPNVPIAKERLEPLGVPVYSFEDDCSLPFSDDQFDFVMNKHESYSPAELKRILGANGEFITQQVGGTDMLELNRILGASMETEFQHWNLAYAVNELEEAGFQVTDKKEAYPTTRFYDIGALVYYLKAIPWQIPDFSIERYRDALHNLHQKINDDGYLAIPSHRFIIKAKV